METERIEASLRDYGDRFVNRIFTEAEAQYCRKMKHSAPHFAVRFAAKEAISKAFGVGIGEHLAWTDLAILRNPKGKPFVELSGKGKIFADEQGITEVMISLSHSDNHAAANALAMCREK